MPDSQKSSQLSDFILHHTIEEDEGRDFTPRATWFNAFLLGIAMKLGGFTVGWNYGFAVGFGEYIVAVALIGIGYALLGLCMAEMISIMAFSGGYYGYARCSLGPFYGYLVGCCGVVECTFQMAISILKISQFITTVCETSVNLEPLWWCLTLGFVLSCHLLGSKWFWQWIACVAFGGMLLVFIYLFGSMPELNFQHHVHHKYADRNPNEFFTVFRFSVMFFLGFDLLTVTSNEVKQPKESIPKAMTMLIGCLFILAIWLMFTVASQEPGIVPELYDLNTMFPLVFGYQNIFGISRKSALCICILPSFASPLGYLYVAGKQIHSMARSGLLPSIFKRTTKLSKVPIFAMLLCIGFALMGLFYSWCLNPYSTLSRVASMGGCFVYITMFWCYLVFNTNIQYKSLLRRFHSPVGIPGAVVGMIIFVGVFIGIMWSSPTIENKITTSLFFVYLLIMTLYYYLHAETHQCFSENEQQVFFQIYLLNLQFRQKQTIWERFTTDIISLGGKWVCSPIVLLTTSILQYTSSRSHQYQPQSSSSFIIDNIHHHVNKVYCVQTRINDGDEGDEGVEGGGKEEDQLQ